MRKLKCQQKSDNFVIFWLAKKTSSVHTFLSMTEKVWRTLSEQQNEQTPYRVSDAMGCTKLKVTFISQTTSYMPSSINMASVCYEHFYSATLIYLLYFHFLCIQGLQWNNQRPAYAWSASGSAGRSTARSVCQWSYSSQGIFYSHDLVILVIDCEVSNPQ